MIEILFETLDDAVWNNNPKLLSDFGYTKDSKRNGDTGLASTISGYHFGCTNGIMNDKLSALGWYTKNEHTLVYNIETLPQVRALAEKVYDSYEAGEFVPLWKFILLYPYYALTHNYNFWGRCSRRLAWNRRAYKGAIYVKPKWADKFWYDEMDLGGDDDVDYNGTYLDIVFDMVEVSHNSKGGA